MHQTHRDAHDSSVVVPAEWLWPGGGGLMPGSLRDDAVLDTVRGSVADPEGDHGSFGDYQPA